MQPAEEYIAPYRLPLREDIEAFAEKLTDEALHCRSWGHQPQEQIVREVTVEGGKTYWEVVLICRNRCGTQWFKLLDQDTGYQVYATTRYDSKYLAHGIGRVSGASRAIVRLESVQRATERK